LATELRYRDLVLDGWNLRVLPERWSNELWHCLLNHIREQVSRRHPQTAMVNFFEKGERHRLFLKTFHPASYWGGIKDWFRDSKALRFLKQGVALSDAGFLVPITIAAGEERCLGILKRAFVVTLGMDGAPLPTFLSEGCSTAIAGIPLVEKRNGLRTLARQIRRFHDLGFIHGDLVPSNILVHRVPAIGLQFYFMDNDRTRRFPKWLPQIFWKRNLVQLNRFPLPSITLQDRMRFFRAYLGAQDSSEANRRLLHWLEAKTRQRRRECDRVDTTGSFRKLMSWQNSSLPTANHGKHQ